jgi:signal transduction histidine kinase
LLQNLGQAMMARASLAITLDVQGASSLPPEVHIACYRIAQEALNNIVKHARARTVKVTLRREAGESGDASDVYLAIEDDGLGFDPQGATVNGLGLNIMRERAAAIGARFGVTSEPGRGTVIHVSWKRVQEEGVQAT